MKTLEEVAPLFDYQRWNLRLPHLARQYAGNHPVPHILLPDFLAYEVVSQAAYEFPRADSSSWTHYQHCNENKLGMAKRELFPASLRALAEELNTPRFLAWLSRLTGIADLIADPSLEGGGLHQAGRGGFLNVHTDFSHHHYHEDWKRRVNLILYLNPAWRAEWGGAIELWDAEMKFCVVKYPPLLNHVLIFNTHERSLHGFPEPIRCPMGESRKSLALYYYSPERGRRMASSSTHYRARPSDGMGKSALIWLDRLAVEWYSRAKARFGFSDEIASRVLGLLSRKNQP
ncbi:MAG TPA: 2OG-Fe(II) oxygenase [Terriglobales bacterium]|nr:2OG-Fe(II) oxygenase [Terriglobales bacterium]